jgi:hypothetical protein
VLVGNAPLDNRQEIAGGEAVCVPPMYGVVVVGAVEIVEDGTGKPSLRQFADVLAIVKARIWN